MQLGDCTSTESTYKIDMSNLVTNFNQTPIFE